MTKALDSKQRTNLGDTYIQQWTDNCWFPDSKNGHLFFKISTQVFYITDYDAMIYDIPFVLLCVTTPFFLLKQEASDSMHIWIILRTASTLKAFSWKVFDLKFDCWSTPSITSKHANRHCYILAYGKKFTPLK